MKNIKLYATAQDFEDNEPQPIVPVDAVDVVQYKSPVSGSYVVTSIIPGIAYVREYQYIAYNNPGEEPIFIPPIVDNPELPPGWGDTK